MLFDWFSAEKPNVYLGSLAVVNNSHFSKIESFFYITGDSLEDHMYQKLEEVFCLHSISSIKEPKKSDIGLDVVIVTLHGGDAFTVDFDTAIIPLFWRPKVKLVSRLYNIEHNKTIKTFSVSKSITWREFIAKKFSLRGFFRWGPLYHTKDMEILLYKACYELLNKMRKAI
ncbi:hypothetical protein CWC16_02420 [Pseudoalteromonas sp. S3776]|uniref:hypothetical protein n=1 Tax=Pseudoalteromonas sp. S3776 TaxID=579544 RepID=UPI0011098AE8|nr:hypothetical protein [Pseudoalteromonas sp. S3776]TMO82003.1 hypothetical protein CWC16_02420 [Pseudoalteromonas sp. S3776]